MGDFVFLLDYQEQFISGFLITLKVSIIALNLSLFLGVIIAILRISPLKSLRFIGTAYVEFFRNTPLVIQVFFFVLSLAYLNVYIPTYIVGSLGLSIYTSSYMAEAIRAGIQAVPQGQMEAARSSGLTYIQTMIGIILPQAFRWMIPALGNQFINLVKNSSVLAVIAGGDLLYEADTIAAEEDVIPIFILVALLYLLLTIPLSVCVNYLEKRWTSTSRGG